MHKFSERIIFRNPTKKTKKIQLKGTKPRGSWVGLTDDTYQITISKNPIQILNKSNLNSYRGISGVGLG